jgi:hypothetical protein
MEIYYAAEQCTGAVSVCNHWAAKHLFISKSADLPNRTNLITTPKMPQQLVPGFISPEFRMNTFNPSDLPIKFR